MAGEEMRLHEREEEKIELSTKGNEIGNYAEKIK